MNPYTISLRGKSGSNKMQSNPLIPRKIINIKGKIHYNESRQAWSNILLKNGIIDEFPALKEKRSKFSYELMFCRTAEDLNKTIKQLIKKGETIPMLMLLYRDK